MTVAQAWPLIAFATGVLAGVVVMIRGRSSAAIATAVIGTALVVYFVGYFLLT